MFRAPRGRKVLVTGHNAEAGEDAVRDLTVSAGGKVRFVKQDVGVPEDCARAVPETIELAPKGITVNAVLPGSIRIGHACLYFASPEAGYVTGQPLVVDGGQIPPESLGAMG